VTGKRKRQKHTEAEKQVRWTRILTTEGILNATSRWRWLTT